MGASFFMSGCVASALVEAIDIKELKP